MPLVRCEVRNEVGLGDPGLYVSGGGSAGTVKRRGGSGGEVDPKALLEGAAVAGLVGILLQLGDLAEFIWDSDTWRDKASSRGLHISMMLAITIAVVAYSSTHVSAGGVHLFPT